MKPHEHGGQIYRWQKEFGLSNTHAIDFSANINPFGPPENVINKIKNELNNLPNYPEPDAMELCVKLSEFHGVSFENVLAGNGASELIDLFFLHLKPKNILLPAPTFKEYERAARAVGSKINNYYTEDKLLKSQLDGFIKRIKEGSPDVVVICTPNNPTGEVLQAEDIEKIANAVKEVKGWLFIDKSFIPFVRERWYELEWESIPENIACIYSFTKIYAIAALRLGYIIGPKELIKRLKTLRNPWSVNHLAQVAGQACLLEKKYERKTRELILEEKEKMIQELKRLDLQPFSGGANYILVKINDNHKGLNSQLLWERMAKQGIFIRNAENFQGLDDKYFRVAIKLPEENDRLLLLLEKCIKDAS